MALANLAQSKSLEDICLTEKQIEVGGFPTEEVVELQIEKTTYGPFWSVDLKDFIENSETGDFFSKAKIKIWNSNEDWQVISEHPYFQRRRPQLISTNKLTENNNNFYLISKGQKHGPLSFEQVTAKLDNKELHYTDLISIDHGQSWGRVFEIEEFERRTHKQTNQLPSSPPLSSLFNVIKKPKKNIVEETLANMAHLGLISNGKININKINQEEVKKEEEEIKEEPKMEIDPINSIKDKPNSSYKTYIFALFIILSSILYFLSNYQKTSIKKPVAHIKRKTNTKIPVIQKTKKKSITKIKKVPPINIRNPTSINSFKRSTPKSRYQYKLDDDSTPYKQDPVRDRFDSKTVNPNLDWVDEVDIDMDKVSPMIRKDQMSDELEEDQLEEDVNAEDNGEIGQEF